MTQETLEERIRAIHQRIAAAAKRSGRAQDEITLIGVSKTHRASAIREACASGIVHFGENRVQEWEGKRGELADVQGYWHLIGHLQSNKAARASRYFHSVDSVDDLTLAQRLDRGRAESGETRKLRILVEVRVGEEVSKSGVSPAELPALADGLLNLEHLDLAGLMCIPPFLEDLQAVRPYFAQLCELKQSLEVRLNKNLPVLSMGMSHDFEVAIEEGATEVRIGSALFGARRAD